MSRRKNSRPFGAYALLGDKDKALDNLETAISQGWHHKEWLTHDTDFDFLRDDPRFIQILSRM